jgi:hypothetical protein
MASLLLKKKKRPLECDEESKPARLACFLSSLDATISSKGRNVSLKNFLTDGNAQYTQGWLRRLLNDGTAPSGRLSKDEKRSLSFLRAILFGIDSKWGITLGTAFGYGETVIRRAAKESVSCLVNPVGKKTLRKSHFSRKRAAAAFSMEELMSAVNEGFLHTKDYATSCLLNDFLNDGNARLSNGWLRRLINDDTVPSGGLSDDDKCSLSFLRAILLGFNSRWAVSLGLAFGYSETRIRTTVAESINNLIYQGVARHLKRHKVTVDDDTEVADATTGTNAENQSILSINAYSIETELALPVEPRVQISSSVGDCAEASWFTAQDSGTLGPSTDIDITHAMEETTDLPENDQAVVRFSDILVQNKTPASDSILLNGCGETSIPGTPPLCDDDTRFTPSRIYATPTGRAQRVQFSEEFKTETRRVRRVRGGLASVAASVTVLSAFVVLLDLKAARKKLHLVVG